MERSDAQAAGSVLRAHERFPTAIAAGVHCSSWRSVEQLVVANVSRGGMFIAAEQPAAIGDSVKLAVTLPDGAVLSLSGTIRHATSAEQAQARGSVAGFGVEIDIEHLETLEQLVAHARAKIRQGASDSTTVTVPQVALATAPPSAPPSAPPTAPAAHNFAAAMGIDLGVSFTRAAIGVDDLVHILPDSSGQRLCASAVYFPARGEPIVGQAARERQALEGERVVTSIKRILGRSYRDPNVAGFLRDATFKAGAGPDDSIVLAIGGQHYAATQVCADILRHVRRQASARAGRELAQVVLTHPVAFGESQQQALRKAAAMAGLEVLELVAEPVAVAYAYGLGQQRNEIVAVYDFGGGTFDFTVIDLSYDSFRVLVTDGDAWLGGDDFDTALATAIANVIWRQTKIELQQRAVEWNALRAACELVKRQLSEVESAELVVPGLDLGQGSPDFRTAIHRTAIGRICCELFERSLAVCRQALDKVGLAPRDMTTVVISGGTSRIPFVRQGLAQFFERPITATVNPEEAVALGAGLVAARRTGHSATRAAAPA